MTPRLTGIDSGLSRDSIIRRSARGTVVVVTSTIGQFLIAFGSQVILARILMPDIFGMFAFVSAAAVFLSNITSIQSEKYLVKESDDVFVKLDVAFTIELALSAMMFFIVLIAGPFALSILGKPDLSDELQLLALIFFYNPLIKPKFLFERELRFAVSRYPKVIAQLLGSGLAVGLALSGFGVWSLIWGRLVTTVSEVGIIWVLMPYRPRLRFRKGIAMEMLRFGWPLVGASVLVYFYWNVDYIIVGTLLSAEQLGYYWLAFQVSQYLLQGKTMINSLLFPAFSRVSNDQDLKKAFLLATKLSAIAFLFPTVLLLAMGEPIIVLIFGEKWIPAVPVFQIFIVLSALRGITQFWDPVFLAKGKTKVFFLLSAINAILIPGIGYPMTIYYGIEGMALAVLFSIVVITPIAAYSLKKILSVDYFSTLRFAVMASVLTFGLSITLVSVFGSRLAGVLVVMSISLAAYGALNYFFHREEFVTLLSLAKKIR